MSVIPPDFGNRFEFARHAAKSAGEHTLKYFRSEFEVDRKGDDSPVTIADREAEQLVRKLIEDSFPGDSILGEEFDDKEGCLLYTSPSPRDLSTSRMPSSA